MSHLGALTLGASLLLSGSALGACVSVGSQLDCRWPGLALQLGTQTNPQAREAVGTVRTHGFAGPVTLGQPPPPSNTLVIGVQNFSNDPHACKRIGNETYCY